MQKQNPVYDLVAPIIESMGFDVVRVLLMGGQRQTLQIMIERKDGKNLVVDDCAAVSRAISDLLDEKDPIDGEYSLEVSSPGIDRPLTKPEHFARFVGYETKIETDESVEGRKRFKGRIVALDDGKVIRFDMDGKEYKIPFDAVAKAKLVLNDELWAEYVEAQEEE
jgi:ribosome maturation factor RimP